MAHAWQTLPSMHRQPHLPPCLTARLRAALHAMAALTLVLGALPAQALRWRVPEHGAITYKRTTQRLAVTPPASSTKIDWAVPSAADGGHEWSWFAGPQNGAPAMWETPGFDDSAWPKGKGEFGADMPQNPSQRTRWASELLLLRSRIDLGKRKPKAVLFSISHDDGIRVYWNGELLIQNDGYGRERTYIIAGKQLAAMQNGGEGLLAVSCSNIGGIQYCDVAVGVLPSLPAGVKTAEDLQQTFNQQREVADHVSREFFSAYRPPGLLLHGELDKAGTRVAVPPGDLREIGFWAACDLERGVTGGSYQQEIPRMLRLGDLKLTGKVNPVGADGWQTMEIGFKDTAEPALRGDTKRFVQMHIAGHTGYGFDGKIAVRRRLELADGTARIAECEVTVTGKFLRGKDQKEHCADFVQRETYAFAEERDGQDANFRVAVQKAIDKGTSFLRAELRNLGSPDLRRDGEEANRSYHAGRLALGLLAMIKGGVKKDDKVLLDALDELRGRKLIDTYSLGNALMALEAFHSSGHDAADLAQGTIDRQRRRAVPDKDKALMQKWTTLLLDNVDTRVDPQYLLRFNYVRDRRFDNSVNQYGLLGLYSAHLCGIETSPALWEAAANHLVTAQCESSGQLDLDLLNFKTLARMQAAPDDKRTATILPVRPAGWTYEDPRRDDENQPAWGSMTCAGITGLAISQAALLDLGQKRIKLQKDADAARHAGFGWLGQNLSLRYHPGHIGQQHSWFYYYLYGLERAALLSGIARIQNRDWYFEGAMVLTGAQADDGSWPGELGHDRAVERAAMAVLFLKRGTAPVLTGQ